MRVIFRLHAIRRMFERNITEQNVYSVIENGEDVELYPANLPYPSRLVLGWVNNRPIHVVIADNEIDDTIIVITVYEPDSTRWESGFRRRKQ